MLIGPEYQHASFPSGHSTAIWVLAGVWLLSRYSGWKVVLGVLSLASLVSLSPLAGGYHHGRAHRLVGGVDRRADGQTMALGYHVNRAAGFGGSIIDRRRGADRLRLGVHPGRLFGECYCDYLFAVWQLLFLCIDASSGTIKPCGYTIDH